MARMADWQITDFEADDEVAFIKIEPGSAVPHRRAVRQDRHGRSTAKKWWPLAVNAACAAGGAIATMLALGAPATVDSHAGRRPDGRMPTAERLAIAAAESSTLTSSDEAVPLYADPVQRALWTVLFGPLPATDAFPDVSGRALAAYSAWAQQTTPIVPQHAVSGTAPGAPY